MRIKTSLLFAVSALCVANPALAKIGDPIEVSDNVELDITANVVTRLEIVDQDNALRPANALTVRGRLGAELRARGFAIFAEGEATGALIDDFNDTLPRNGVEPFSVVADPENIELNQVHVSYKVKGSGVTLGRQKLNHANQRFLGSVSWRQNEQTFDAVRGELAAGKFKFDAAYAISQRTIFGARSPNEFFDGDFVFLKGDYDGAAIDVSVFSYLIDYETRLAFSSDTVGVTAALKVPGTPLSVTGTYATQSDAGANPVDFSADYIAAEVGAGLAGFNFAAGYEELGSDGGVAAFQTPLATLHAFNGWADLFLVTPAAGLRDYYGKVTKKIEIGGLPALNATVLYHEFEADVGGANYGSEWNAALGFKVDGIGFLLKYANYNADSFGVDTEKFWLQMAVGF